MKILFCGDYDMKDNSKIEEFIQLSYDEKLKISMNIIVNLKDRGNAQAKDIFDYISTIEKIPEHILETIYTDFEDSIEKIKGEKIQSDLHKFSKSEEYIHQLKEREFQERVQENPEGILDQI